MQKLEIVNISDVGKKRPHNEDSTVSDARLGMVLVADGMGGYKAGEVASAIAATTVLNDIDKGLPRIENTGLDGTQQTGYSPHSNLLRDAISHANSLIYKTAKEDEQCHGMGTTIVVGLFYDGMVSIANVGDSRLYRLRDDQFKQITKDHSLLQEIIDKGVVSVEEAMATTPKNLVTRALGIDTKVKIDIFEEQVKDGDIYLLCSDGLNDMVNDEEIHLTLSKYNANLSQAAKDLVSMANIRGGRDNISVVLTQIKSTHRNGSLLNFIKRIFKK